MWTQSGKRMSRKHASQRRDFLPSALSAVQEQELCKSKSGVTAGSGWEFDSFCSVSVSRCR